MLVVRGAWGTVARVAVVLSVCLMAARGHAQEASPMEDLARAHFNTGSVAFGAGRYSEALVEFQKAYELSQRPKLLYNIGVASDRLRRDREALAAFEQYLQRVPEAPERAEVEARIAVLRDVVNTPSSTTPPASGAAAATTEAAETSAPTDAIESTDADPQPASHPSVAQWLVLGASGVMAVTGGVLLTVALLDKSAVESPSDGVGLDEIDSARDRVPLFSTLGGVFLGVGLVGAGVATTWIVLSGSGSEGALEAHVGLGRVSLRGTF
jgi:tetratricopeptide (TPR) repeat protein